MGLYDHLFEDENTENLQQAFDMMNGIKGIFGVDINEDLSAELEDELELRDKQDLTYEQEDYILEEGLEEKRKKER